MKTLTDLKTPFVLRTQHVVLSLRFQWTIPPLNRFHHLGAMRASFSDMFLWVTNPLRKFTFAVFLWCVFSEVSCFVFFFWKLNEEEIGKSSRSKLSQHSSSK